MQIFIAGFPLTFENKALRDLFELYGTVTSVRIIKDKETGLSRGFGFVQMPDETEAKLAIKSLHRDIIEENNITVKEARPKEGVVAQDQGTQNLGTANKGGTP